MGVFLRGVLNVSLKSGGFVKESNFFFLESVFGERGSFPFLEEGADESRAIFLLWDDGIFSLLGSLLTGS